MTREHKLALITGFALVLIVGMLVSDHFSKAKSATLAPVGRQHGSAFLARPADAASAVSTRVLATNRVARVDAPLLDAPLPKHFNKRGHSRDIAVGATPPSDGETLRALTHAGQSEPFVPAAQTQRVSLPALQRSAMPAGTRRVRVRDGETLWSICVREYGDGALYKKVARYNKDRVGAGAALHAGSILLLPPRTMLTGAAAVPPTKPRQTTITRGAGKRPAGIPHEYIVKKGDTLSEVAQKTLGSWRRMDEIIKLNRDQLTDADDVRVGMRLRLPRK